METIYTYTIHLEPAPEGGYTVTVPALPGCVTEGETFEDAVAMARDAIQLYLESLALHGETIPIEAQSHSIETIVRVPVSVPA